MKTKIVVALAATALLLAGCTGDDTDSGSTPTIPNSRYATPTPTAAQQGAEAGIDVGLATDEARMSAHAERAAEVIEGMVPETVTVTVTVEPTPEVSEEIERDVALLSMDLMWDSTDQVDKDIICEGWSTPGGQDIVMDSFLEGAAEAGENLTREDLRDFFDGVC